MIVLIVSLVIVIGALVSGMIALVLELISKPSNSHKPYGLYERCIKRFLDAFLSTCALIVLSPVLIIVAIIVKIKLGSPVLFIQDRPGKDGKIFKLYKFRTMTNEKDESGVLLSDNQRSTGFGLLLRKTSLDELPELINIFKGDMAIVGPRPLLPEYLPYYTLAEQHRHDVRPGLTGQAQISGRSFLSWEQVFQYDLDYIKCITLTKDSSIILKTVMKVIKKEDIADTSNVFSNESDKKVHKPLNIERG